MAKNKSYIMDIHVLNIQLPVSSNFKLVSHDHELLIKYMCAPLEFQPDYTGYLHSKSHK